jgi:NitT/TauT family transport system ATP-binding protein
MTEVEAQSVTRSFGGEAVLDNISLCASSREILAIVGRSGSGKSTLLRILAGLIQPTGGTVIICGKTPTTALAERSVAYVWQEDSLLPWLSALDNVVLALRVGPSPLSLDAARTVASDMLAEVGLGAAHHKRPAALSGGMRQRVALARALATRARILLLDEPFSSLDELTRETLLELVRSLVDGKNLTCVMATHNLTDAATIADRVVALAGSPSRVGREVKFETPATRLVSDEEKALRAAHLARMFRMVATC